MKQYLELMEEILLKGERREDRTGVGTYSLFGRQLRFEDVAARFPLVTTKRVHWESVVHELIWFLMGDTNLKYLHDNNVTIWDEWADPAGNLGPIYGHQWRSWPAPETAAEVTGARLAYDQIMDSIRLLKEEPHSRRNVISAWNVPYLDQMALQPCHVMFQVSCRGKGYNTVDLHMYQRSADYFLGVPFNIASYALLLTIMARAAGKKAGDLIISFGDVHLYQNHVEQVVRQLRREPKELPRIYLKPPSHWAAPDIHEKRIRVDPIRGVTDEELSIVLRGYHPYKGIKAPVAV